MYFDLKNVFELWANTKRQEQVEVGFFPVIINKTQNNIESQTRFWRFCNDVHFTNIWSEKVRHTHSYQCIVVNMDLSPNI